MANSSAIRTLPPTGQSSSDTNGVWNDTFPFGISQSLMLLGKVLWLLFLLGLFALSFVVWVWIASFRAGWRFWQWVEARHEPQQIFIGLMYGTIILIVSPFFLFFDWAQKQFEKVLPEWMKLPTDFPFRKLFEERLGIELGDELPFFIEAKPDTSEQQASSNSSD